LAYHNFPSAVPGKRMAGRMEMVRLLLTDAGATFEDVELNHADLVAFSGPKVDSGFSSHFAPPLVQKVNEAGEVVFQISNLSAILEWLAEDLGSHYSPPNVAQRGCARQVAADLSDFLSDGRAPYHAKNMRAGYDGQKDEPEVIQAIADFQAEGGRLSKWLGHFESFLAAAERRGAGGTPYFASSDEPTYVDFYAYQGFLGANKSYPNCLDKYPRINAMMRALESRPRIEAHLASDNRWHLAGNSCA